MGNYCLKGKLRMGCVYLQTSLTLKNVMLIHMSKNREGAGLERLTHRARSHWSCKMYKVAEKTEPATLQSCSALLDSFVAWDLLSATTVCCCLCLFFLVTGPLAFSSIKSLAECKMQNVNCTM